MSIVLYFITKVISEYINLKESNGSLKSVKSIRVKSYTRSYSFIRWWVNVAKTYLSSFVAFTRNKLSKWDPLRFSKEEISRFHIWNLGVVKSLGRKVLFFKLPQDYQNFMNFQYLCVYSCYPSHELSRTTWIMPLLQIFEECAIPKINMLRNLSCCETRFRLLCRWYLLHSSLNLVFRQHKL